MYFEYSVPFKKGKEIACFDYDYAFYCDMLYHILPFYSPEYLTDFYLQIKHHSSEFPVFKKSKPQFPDGYRIYIFDNRANVLFATIDPSGDISNFFHRYYREERHNLTAWYFDNNPDLSTDLITGQYNLSNLERFAFEYNFIPVEELFAASYLILNKGKKEEMGTLSQYQTQILLDKFRKYNYIDWRKLVHSIQF